MLFVARAVPFLYWLAMAVYILGVLFQGEIFARNRRAGHSLIAVFLWGTMTFIGYGVYSDAVGWVIADTAGCPDFSKTEEVEKLDDRGLVKVPYDVVADERQVVANCRNNSVIIDTMGAKAPATIDASFQRVVYNKERNEYAGGTFWGNSIIVYDTGTWNIKARLDVEDSKLIDIDYDDGKYYLITEDGRFYIVNDDGFAVERFEKSRVSAYSIKIDSRRKKLYLTQWAMGCIVKFDLETMAPEKKKRFRTYVFGVDVDEEHGSVLMAQPTKSRIAVLDSETLAVRRYLDAGYGVRDVQLDAGRGVVHSANYFDGTYTQTSYETGEIIKKVPVGPLARGVYHDSGTGETYAVSKCGVFRIADNKSTNTVVPGQ